MIDQDYLRLLNSKAFYDYALRAYRVGSPKPFSLVDFQKRIFPLLVAMIIFYLNKVDLNKDARLSLAELEQFPELQGYVTSTLINATPTDSTETVAVAVLSDSIVNDLFASSKNPMDTLERKIRATGSGQLEASLGSSRVSVPNKAGKSLDDYCDSHEGCGAVPRSFMPQFHEEGSLDDYVKTLQQIDPSVRYLPSVKVMPEAIQPMQSNANNRKVQKLARIFEAGGWSEEKNRQDPFLLLKKGDTYYLLNGHHRFFAVNEYNKRVAPERKVTKFDANVIDIKGLSLAQALEATFYVEGIRQKTLGGEKVSPRIVNRRRLRQSLLF